MTGCKPALCLVLFLSLTNIEWHGLSKPVQFHREWQYCFTVAAFYVEGFRYYSHEINTYRYILIGSQYAAIIPTTVYEVGKL